MSKFVPEENQPPLKSIYELIAQAKITQEDIDQAVKEWQENNPDFDNILVAEIKREEK